MRIKKRIKQWYTKPRSGELAHFSNWIYKDSFAFKIVYITSLIAPIIFFGAILFISLWNGFNVIFVIIFAVLFLLSSFKLIKSIKNRKALKLFLNEYTIEKLTEGGKNAGNIPEETTGSLSEGDEGFSRENDENRGKSKRTSEGISFSLCVAEADSGKIGNKTSKTTSKYGGR